MLVGWVATQWWDDTSDGCVQVPGLFAVKRKKVNTMIILWFTLFGPDRFLKE